MNAAAKAPNPYKPAAEGDERELFVTTDIRSIPAMELLPMCSGISEWLTAILVFKILRTKSDAVFACESRRLVKVDVEQVSKRIMKHFDVLRPRVEDLGFTLNYYASMPALGPITAAVMTMSQRNGKIHFFATQVALKANDQINDDGHFGFGTHLQDGGSILTVSPAKLPKPRRGIDRLVMSSDQPLEVLKKHRERIRDAAIENVPPNHLLEYAERETRLEADDLQRRRIIRPATPAEIGRIRSGS